MGNHEIKEYTLSLLISEKLRANSIFETSMRANKERQDSVKAQLMEVTANGLNETMITYLEDANFFEDLMTHGTISRKIAHDDDYGFKSHADIKKQFETLRKLWGNSISLRLRDESYRTVINVSVVMR